VGDLAAVAGAATGADDADPPAVEGRGIAPVEQHARRLMVVGENGRVTGPAEREHADACLQVASPEVVDVDRCCCSAP